MDRAAGNRKLGENRSKLERGLMRYLIWLTLVTTAPGNISMAILRASAELSAWTVTSRPLPRTL
jgi:hypothetical protein